MIKISNIDGKHFETMSNEIYKITSDDHPSGGYKTGSLVRKISGADGSPIVGYHFTSGYSTVCRLFSSHAEYCGIENVNLELIWGEEE